MVSLHTKQPPPRKHHVRRSCPPPCRRCALTGPLHSGCMRGFDSGVSASAGTAQRRASCSTALASDVTNTGAAPSPRSAAGTVRAAASAAAAAAASATRALRREAHGGSGTSGSSCSPLVFADLASGTGSAAAGDPAGGPSGRAASAAADMAPPLPARLTSTKGLAEAAAGCCCCCTLLGAGTGAGSSEAQRLPALPAIVGAGSSAAASGCLGPGAGCGGQAAGATGMTGAGPAAGLACTAGARAALNRRGPAPADAALAVGRSAVVGGGGAAAASPPAGGRKAASSGGCTAATPAASAGTGVKVAQRGCRPTPGRSGTLLSFASCACCSAFCACCPRLLRSAESTFLAAWGPIGPAADCCIAGVVTAGAPAAAGTGPAGSCSLPAAPAKAGLTPGSSTTRAVAARPVCVLLLRPPDGRAGSWRDAGRPTLARAALA